MLGKITFWNDFRGYGFITVTTTELGATIEKQYFFHRSNFQNGTPVLNAFVVFGLGEPLRVGKDLQAVGVRLATPTDIGEHALLPKEPA